MKIYTRKGDDGSTGLWYGGRVPKSGGRPEAYGAVDEAASALGMTVAGFVRGRGFNVYAHPERVAPQG